MNGSKFKGSLKVFKDLLIIIESKILMEELDSFSDHWNVI